MAEIATEDGTKEEEDEELASGERRERDEKGEEGEKEEEAAENKSQTSGQSKASSEANVCPAALESDSDTDDEDDEEVVTTSTPKSPTPSNQTAPLPPAVAPLSASHTPSPPPSASPAGAPSIISGITVTEATVPPGTPPSPGRCISVSSPGRRHKIFMVTRVECPPEQKQQPQKCAPAAPSLYKESTERPVDINTPVTQQTQPPPASRTPTQTQLSSPAPPAVSKMPGESPISRLESGKNPHKAEPQSVSQPSDEATTRTLASATATDQSPQTPALSSNSSVQAEALLPTEGLEENPETPPPEPPCLEGNQGGENRELSVADDRQVIPPESLSTLTAEVEQLHIVQTSEEQLSPKQTESVLPQQEVPVNIMGNQKPSSTQEEEPNQEEASPKQQSETEPEADPDSADDSSADECFADALEGEVVSSALPNGLKPEFSLHCLDNESPKPGSCVMEHGECRQLWFGSHDRRLSVNACCVSFM